MGATDRPLYAGFDLGTTNSAGACFDGEKLSVIRNSHGNALTPSVVRLDSKGRMSVGERALRYVEGDSDNTHREFKRMMGTDKRLSFPAAGTDRSPEELSAAILEAMRSDVNDQLGVLPERAVISVPALFELPQNTATSEAGRIAGFERVELLQEPIASALAAGWTDEDGAGSWLVYDLGGGTFDVSLLETRDGLLRVVGHDGDNFLGGRDFDMAVVDWALLRLRDSSGVDLSRSNPDHAPAIAAIKRAAEETKIELSRAHETVLSLPAPLEVDGSEIEVDLDLDRNTLEGLCAPIVDRTMKVCQRLLESQGMRDDQLLQVVLVGGPTAMPYLRSHVAERLDTQVAEGHDPMTLVAQGAALYAATAGLDGRPVRAPKSSGHKLWLQYPAVSSDLTPHVVGRLVDRGERPIPATLKLLRADGDWTGPDISIDDDGAFICTANLVARTTNEFRIEASAADGSSVEVQPATFRIVQGLTITDPPLSRSIGVALANDSVKTYFERGAPLPARRTFTHQTVESVAKGSSESVLKIPLVQGEFDQAHLCRLIGTIEIPGSDIRDSVATGATVEVTLELDRGGRLTARALVPDLSESFDSVARLLVPAADPETLAASIAELRTRLDSMRTTAFRQGATRVIEHLATAGRSLTEIERDVEASRGGDHDAGQKARRSLLELDAEIETIELSAKWPELEDAARDDMTFASEWVTKYGTPSEKKLLEEVALSVDQARASQNVAELQRQLRLARRLGTAAFYRHPEAWEWMFDSAASNISQATNLPEGERLVRQGREALEYGDMPALRRATEALWKLLPGDVADRRMCFDSGVR